MIVLRAVKNGNNTAATYVCKEFLGHWNLLVLELIARLQTFIMISPHISNTNGDAILRRVTIVTSIPSEQLPYYYSWDVIYILINCASRRIWGVNPCR